MPVFKDRKLQKARVLVKSSPKDPEPQVVEIELVRSRPHPGIPPSPVLSHIRRQLWAMKVGDELNITSVQGPPVCEVSVRRAVRAERVFLAKEPCYTLPPEFTINNVSSKLIRIKRTL